MRGSGQATELLWTSVSSSVNWDNKGTGTARCIRCNELLHTKESGAWLWVNQHCYSPTTQTRFQLKFRVSDSTPADFTGSLSPGFPYHTRHLLSVNSSSVTNPQGLSKILITSRTFLLRVTSDFRLHASVKRKANCFALGPISNPFLRLPAP